MCANEIYLNKNDLNYFFLEKSEMIYCKIFGPSLRKKNNLFSHLNEK